MNKLLFLLAMPLLAADVRIENLRLKIDGEETPPRFFYCEVPNYWSGRNWDELSSETNLCTMLSELSMARDAGVRIVSFSAPFCWTETEDLAPLDKIFSALVSRFPDLLLVPRFWCNAPQWWLEKHPAARLVHSDGTASECNKVYDADYRRDVCNHLRKVCRHLRETFPQNLAGVHPGGQGSYEWYSYALFDRGPAKSDDLRAFNENMAETAALVCRAARESLGEGKLVFAFYGYVFEHYWIARPGTSGHFALGRFLDRASGCVDVMCAPFNYTDRGWLGGSLVMSAAETIQRRGILWCCEDDTRTFLAWRLGVRSFTPIETREKTLDVLARNRLQALSRGYASWWMDLNGTGWFDDKNLWTFAQKLATLETLSGNDEAEVAVAVDEDSMILATQAQCRPFQNLRNLARFGASYGNWLLSDILANGCKAKLVLVFSALPPDNAKRAALRKTLPDATLAWICGAEKHERTEIGARESLVRTPFIAQTLLRELAREANVHLYTDVPDTWIAGNRKFIAAQSPIDGTLPIRLLDCRTENTQVRKGEVLILRAGTLKSREERLQRISPGF